MREQALAKRHLSTKNELLAKLRLHKPLVVGDVVQVQNQRGNNPNKWDNSATVVEVLPYDSYIVKMDGSGRVSKRNRQFLKPIVPFINTTSSKLPNQTFTDDVIRKTPTDNHDADNLTKSNQYYTGPSADSREASLCCTRPAHNHQQTDQVNQVITSPIFMTLYHSQ